MNYDATFTDLSVNHCKPQSEMIMMRWWHSALDDDELLSDRWRMRIRHHRNPRNVDQLATVWSFRSCIGKVRKGGQREDGDAVPRLQLQPRLTGFRMLEGWSRSGAEFSAPAAYWETRDCTVALTKCGRNRWDALFSRRWSRESKPSRVRTVFKVSPYLATVNS